MKLACKSTVDKWMNNNEKGSSSVLVVMIMLLMITFGVLAMMSSYSNLKIARKHAEWTKDYYSLESQGDFNLMHFNGVLDDVVSRFVADDFDFKTNLDKREEVLVAFFNALDTSLGGAANASYGVSSNFKSYAEDESGVIEPMLSILTMDEASGRRLITVVAFETEINTIGEMKATIVEWREIPDEFEYDDALNFSDPEGN